MNRDFVAEKRIRTNIIETLEMFARPEKQIEYQNNVKHVYIPTEIICWWEDFVQYENRETYMDDIYTTQELKAIWKFHKIWDKEADLVDATRFPVHKTGRGGQYTYHGPGQRVAYVMLDLRKRTQDVRAFVAGLEAWIIATLASFNVTGERREDRVGVWVRRPEKAAGSEDKVAAIGIRVTIVL